MDYAQAAAAELPALRKEDSFSVLAHFSQSHLSPSSLLFAVLRAAKISPFGIKSHPKGAILTFSSSKERESALSSKVFHGKSQIPLTSWPILSTPPAERGRRWRMSNVPFSATASLIKDALSLSGFPPTEVKLETVPLHPNVRTDFATFWIADSNAQPPSFIIINEQKCPIFDPVKKAPIQPKDQPKEQQPKEKAKEQPMEKPIPLAAPAPSIAPATPAAQIRPTNPPSSNELPPNMSTPMDLSSSSPPPSSSSPFNDAPLYLYKAPLIPDTPNHVIRETIRKEHYFRYCLSDACNDAFLFLTPDALPPDFASYMQITQHSSLDEVGWILPDRYKERILPVGL